MLIHLQLCEALNAVMSHDPLLIKEFQTNKLDEIFRYSKSSDTLKPTLKLMRKRVDAVAKYFWT
jgi:hypothetical protein